MNKQIQQETQEIRERKRTQSDELSVCGILQFLIVKSYIIAEFQFRD